MLTAKLRSVAATVAAVGLLGLVGVGTVLAWPRTGSPVVTTPKPGLPLGVVAPDGPERPIEGDWLPKKEGTGTPTTAFPNLKAVGPKELAKACPLLFGDNAITIEPTDDTYRRLLKARLYQATLETAKFRKRFLVGQYVSTEFPFVQFCLDDLQATVIELWGNDPKALVPRLEEVVVLAKEWERLTNARVEAGTDPPQQMHTAQRYRLSAETTLWKAKTGQLGGR